MVKKAINKKVYLSLFNKSHKTPKFLRTFHVSKFHGQNILMSTLTSLLLILTILGKMVPNMQDGFFSFSSLFYRVIKCFLLHSTMKFLRILDSSQNSKNLPRIHFQRECTKMCPSKGGSRRFRRYP